MSTRHTNLLNAICKWLKPMSDVWYTRIAGSSAQRRGIPDILICYRGRWLCFEAKIGADKLSPSQRIQKQRLQRAEAIVNVPETLDEAKATFGRFKLMAEGRAAYDE